MLTPGLGRAKLGTFASRLETRVTQFFHLTIVLKNQDQIEQTNQDQPSQIDAQMEK